MRLPYYIAAWTASAAPYRKPWNNPDSLQRERNGACATAEHYLQLSHGARCFNDCYTVVLPWRRFLPLSIIWSYIPGNEGNM
ncbi:MAG: hypothetical protein WCC86_09165 [Methanoregula sp.]|uniref:hypothetical protein n=1 Tax=Methanoregula sp. TaxID=2052170 RepID=UPI003BAE6686